MSAVPSERVLILAPRGRDAELTIAMLATHHLEGVRCASAEELLSGIRGDAGCAILTVEVLDEQLHAQLQAVLADQPAWSDFPMIVLSSARTRFDRDLGNMTILERPTAPETLVTAVRSALRGRRRQYEARAAIQQRDQFLAMLGHELRNPLAAIMLASDGATSTNPAVVEKRMGVVARQAAHLTRLVNDLLDVARVTSGKLQLQREPVELDALIRSSAETFEPRARERGITLKLELAAAVTSDGDPGRLEQVIGNLMTNAVKYSPAGKTVTIRSSREADRCVVRVADEGIGIAPEMLPRVFDLFTQADGNLARSDGGLGVGLALVDRLIRLHGGTASVRSAGLGHGSEFMIELPIGDACPQRVNTPSMAAAVERPLRVVIVEDNPDLLELTAAVVEHLGCTTEKAADGEAGLELILASQPDLALIDVGLPKLDGYAVAEQLHAKALPTKLIAVTGYGQKSDRDRALAAGFHAHITKPVRAATLQQLIDETRQHLTA